MYISISYSLLTKLLIELVLIEIILSTHEISFSNTVSMKY